MLTDLKNIRIEDYDYPLPDEKIARYPLAQRDASKMMLLRGESMSEHCFSELPDLLPSDTMLVFNNTRVIHARLLFRKSTGALIEIFCLEPYGMAISQAFEQREQCSWLCYVGNNKRWRSGDIEMPIGEGCVLTASRREMQGDAWVIDLRWSGGLSFAEVIEQAGKIPLPPYLGRPAEESDAERYQTVYAEHNGSVAAPTAGLHFTPHILDRLSAEGIHTEYITLHVGAGTFKPVVSATIGEHEMHTEPVQVSLANLEHLIAHQGKPIVAVGTTSVRTLESLYWFGVQLHSAPDLPTMHVGQWEPYTLSKDSNIEYTEAYSNIVRWMQRRNMDVLYGYTQLLIAPGYTYRVIDGIITNFHQPKSTLLLLVSAWIGDRWRELYRYALQHGFRFLSYGDCCLLLP